MEIMHAKRIPYLTSSTRQKKINKIEEINHHYSENRRQKRSCLAYNLTDITVNFIFGQTVQSAGHRPNQVSHRAETSTGC